MNALDQAMFEAIEQVGEQINADKSIRAVVLSGAGGNFCSGLDKSSFEGLLNGSSILNSLAERSHGIANRPQHAVWLWRELAVPVICAIEGMALGGGLQIALGADMRIASRQSQYSILELKWGIIPDMGSSQILPHLVRDDVLRELTYTARTFSASEAKEWGFITDIADSPLERAMALASDIANKNPDAIRASKRVINQSYHQSIADGLLMESVEQDRIMGSDNQIEAVMAVLQKRTANFKD